MTLTETDTIWLLDLPGTHVAEDHEFAVEEKEKIQKYEEVRKRMHPDYFCLSVLFLIPDQL